MLPEENKILLKEALGHVRLRHHQEVREAIQNLTYELANKGLTGSSVGSKEGTRLLGEMFDQFVDRVWAEAKRVLEHMSVDTSPEQDIIALLNAVLDPVIQSDAQMLLNVADHKTGAVVAMRFQQRCQLTKGKVATEVKIFCMGRQTNTAAAPQDSKSSSGQPGMPQKEQLVTLGEWVGTKDGGFVKLAIVFSDIIDSTKLNQELGDAKWSTVLAAHLAQARALVKKHNGWYVKVVGDEVIAVFKSDVEALEYAMDLEKNTGHELVQIKSGVNFGEVKIVGSDILGNEVNLTARIQAQAARGGIWMSDVVHRSWLGRHGRASILFTEHPGVPLKGVEEAGTLWSLPPSWSSAPLEASDGEHRSNPIQNHPIIRIADVVKEPGKIEKRVPSSFFAMRRRIEWIILITILTAIGCVVYLALHHSRSRLFIMPNSEYTAIIPGRWIESTTDHYKPYIYLECNFEVNNKGDPVSIDEGSWKLIFPGFTNFQINSEPLGLYDDGINNMIKGNYQPPFGGSGQFRFDKSESLLAIASRNPVIAGTPRTGNLFFICPLWLCTNLLGRTNDCIASFKDGRNLLTEYPFQVVPFLVKQR